MSVYLLNIALIFIWAFFLLKYKPSKNKKKAFCAIACVQWVILSGLRGMTVGADTIEYRRGFNRVNITSWHRIITDISAYIGGAEIKDPGYALFVKIFQVFSTNYQLYLVFIAVLFMIPMAIWIYKNSSMPCLSFIIFSTLFYSFYAVTGIRQTIATSLVEFIGYEFIKKKKQRRLTSLLHNRIRRFYASYSASFSLITKTPSSISASKCLASRLSKWKSVTLSRICCSTTRRSGRTPMTSS